MSEETNLAPDLVQTNVLYMQQMMYLAQGYADWDDDFIMTDASCDDGLDGV